MINSETGEKYNIVEPVLRFVSKDAAKCGITYVKTPDQHLTIWFYSLPRPHASAWLKGAQDAINLKPHCDTRFRQNHLKENYTKGYNLMKQEMP